jgi:hypothetical protein
MPKRRRGERSDDEAETTTFSMPEDNTPSTITPTATTTFSPPLQKQVFKVSEWTVETDRVSTSNNLFSMVGPSMAESVPSMSFSDPDHDLHIPDDYYDAVDVSDFQPPPEPLQPSGSANAEKAKSSKERFLVFFSP